MEGRNNRRPIVVSVVSDHPIVRAGIRALLAPQHHLVVIADDENPEDVDVVVYDVFGVRDDDRDLEQAVKRHPGRVLALSRVLQPGLTARALGLGAVGSTSIDADAEELVSMIEATATGRLEDGSPTDLANQRNRDHELGRDALLSPREQDVLELIVAGATNDDIALELYLTINTVKSVIRSAYRKIGVTSRAQAVAWGIDHGFPSGDRGDRPEPPETDDLEGGAEDSSAASTVA